MSRNLRNAKGLFRPARLIWTSLRYGLLMPIACGRRMFAAESSETYSSHIHWVNSKIKDRSYHIRALTDLAEGTSLLQLVDSCLQNNATRAANKHSFVFGDMDDSYSLSLVKVRVALNIMETKGVVERGQFSADMIASGDIEHIRGVVVKLALFPTTLQRTKNLPTEVAQAVEQRKVTEVWWKRVSSWNEVR